MKPRTTKTKYTFIGFRPTKQMDKRLRALSRETGKKISQIIFECINGRLAEVEKSEKKVA